VSVSISEILAGASVHAVPLVGECAGYLVLAAADQAVMAPRRIGPTEVHLEGDGSVRVDGARAADEADSEADLRALLDALLLNASSATPALLRASRRAPGRGIAALVREIETALIPVNRAAAHRALARLERETERARERGRLSAAPVLPSRSAARPEAPIVPAPPPPVVATPVPPAVAAASPPSVAPPAVAAAPLPSVAPPAVAAAPLPIVEEAQEIPSLFAPPVEPIAANTAEIETRPEPILVRRSAPPPLPSRTPSPVAPVVEYRSPPPPLPSRTPSPAAPVAEAQRATPFFGTVLLDSSEDDMEIEIDVDDEELMDEELTGVLVRSAPLEVTAMTEAATSREPTDPCPPVLEDEASDTERTAAQEALEISEDEISGPEGTILLAPVAERPAPEASTQDAEVPQPEASDPPEPDILVLEGTVILPPPAEIAAAENLPPALAPSFDEASARASADEASEPPDETLALALALGVEPAVAELPPILRLPMPKPRPSDVNELLEQMSRSDVDGSDDLRTSLKGMAGIEPTPPPPEL
jgi:hypothetical protein